MTPDEFRKAGHAFIDLVADYRAGIAARPVMAQVKPGDIAAALPRHAPETPEPLPDVLADIARVIEPGLTQWQHPKFFGYFPANAGLPSALADLLSTGFGQIGLNWQASPALTELEEVTLGWMREALGLSPHWSGVIQDTASTATLVALICAREQATGQSAARGGLQAAGCSLVVYTSSQAHSSVDKAALLAGFGRDNIRHVDVDNAFAMDLAALRRAIEADIAAGRKPCAIVATTGTTATTAIDPIEGCAALAREFGLWLHVDAAMGGAAMVLPECRHLWHGVEHAHSLVVNAHKWLGVAFDCSLYFVRDPAFLVQVMSTNPSYLQTAADGQAKNYRDWGIPLGRRFRALKLWLTLRLEGLGPIRARLRRDIANARWLADEVGRTPDWKVLAPVALQTLCIRHEPQGLSGEALDRHTLAWVDAINRSGRALLTPSTIGGRWMARVSIGALQTEHSHVAELWQEITQAAAAQRM